MERWLPLLVVAAAIHRRSPAARPRLQSDRRASRQARRITGAMHVTQHCLTDRRVALVLAADRATITKEMLHRRNHSRTVKEARRTRLALQPLLAARPLRARLALRARIAGLALRSCLALRTRFAGKSRLAARAFGKRNLAMTLPIGIVFAFAVWVVFSQLLMLHLPAGPLERLFFPGG